MKRREPGDLLEECLGRGIGEFVVCAGARNAPLVMAILQVEGAGVWNHFEERGAGFFALGRTMATGKPCAVVTTSGTAVAELLPAVIEAHYQQRPLVLITADRPARFRGTGAPQAIAQEGIFGVYAATELSGWDGRGPLHLNVELEEDEAIPAMRPGHDRGRFETPRLKIDVSDAVRFLRADRFKGIVALLGGLEASEREDAYHFLKAIGVPVLADATSGMREALGKLALADGNRLLRERPPQKVLRIGDIPVGRFWRDLDELPDVEVCSLTRTGLPGLARESIVVHGEIDRLLRGMGEVESIGDVDDHLPESARRRARLDELLARFPDSEPAMMRELSVFASVGEEVFLGNSLPIREWNEFAQVTMPVVNVRASRGANGIDGQLSTWLGATAGLAGAWGIFGDLTVLYDLAAPAMLEQEGRMQRVLAVINNGGGRIFERLPRMQGMDARQAAVMANAHQTGFGPWAAMWGMDHVRVASRDEFEIDPGPGTTVLEICPDRAQTEAFWAEWQS
ncbi:MAG: hypothetical protein HKN82_14075 [Akkermansiaceae bacterium]|nr:hypothetical protein [Akkermansiaceae bacterium]NNM30848.1 hypothetical protein [Akkermansiaceae bacterium]